MPQQQVLLVHNVYTTEEDIAFIHETGNKVFWCLCPNANHYINRTLPNLAMFIKNNASLVLGTDSLASNHQLSIWEEIQTLRKAYEDVPLASMLQWATSNGAKALKIDAQYGSFEKANNRELCRCWIIRYAAFINYAPHGEIWLKCFETGTLPSLKRSN
ncbi:amidohydrolase family protein [Niabella sp. W65]|nr:amidohydrolase family protein [Niabella sp. W65]MCH7368652.1 amidohydrolase family protein [Niabella sp. W65]ULT44232.1 amidohydrolase family protein [Niabella sp. I65]